ncbi:plasmid recombination protein [Roseobacter sp. GAI101]|uniref:plasmid recombination protein n=1 Tax=Roseobacter sp. (strain GAI101) TaxID=391589 RepID=UPI00018716FD|nr:plasmid recombination protein [Roseobacter sp. GAI101]EEB86253.1 plasmid recombination enzyme, putative [Roseobacter sp. GAI101]
MTNTKQNTPEDAAAANPNAVSVRIQPKAMAKAKFQRRHDFRIGKQPAYVDEDRTELNRHLMELRPLPDIQRENEALRKRAGRTRKIKSNAAVVTVGIVTFGQRAQEVFNRLPVEMQDRAFRELAQEIAAKLKTSLEALVVHLDETAIHAHFTMRAYNDDGEPISNATRLGDMSALQDLAAEVMQRYAPEIERGKKKQARLEAGAKYSDTFHRTVKQLHQDLPREKAALEAEIATMSQEINEQKASVAKTQRHLQTLEAKAVLTEKEIKRKETYSKRLEKKQAAMAADMEQLEARRVALEAAMAQKAEAIEVVQQAVRTERQEVQAQMNAVRAAKETYERGAKAIEAVLTEAENETLVYDPDTGKTTMQDPTPLKGTPQKLRAQIVKLAKRIAFVESNLFARIFRLDEQISRIRAFLTRNDLPPEVKNEAQEIIDDPAGEEPGLG